MNETFSRTERLASLMQTELALLFQKEVEDIRLRVVTITRVKLSADLSCAKIYVVVHDEAQAERTIKLLKKAAKFLRYQLAHRMEFRKVPELHFYYDTSIARGSRIAELLDHSS